MEMKKFETDKPVYVPQMKVRSDMRGGASVEACQNNIDYWKKIYNDKLKKANC